MEENPTSYSIEDKFKQQIDERFDLWASIIDDSQISKEAKDEIKKRLSDFKEGAFTKWANFEEAFHGTISSILTVTEQARNKDGARALFENIRDDIWALLEEINYRAAS